MPGRPAFARARPPPASPRPHASDSFRGLLEKLSDAYTSVESDNSRLLNALKVAQGLSLTEDAELAAPFDSLPERSSITLMNPNSQNVRPIHDRDHHLSEAARTELGDNTASLNRAFTHYTTATNGEPVRSESEARREAAIKEHDCRRKFAKIADRSDANNRSMFQEIDVMIAERQVLSPRRPSMLMTCEEAMGAINLALGRANQHDTLSFEAFRDLFLCDDLEGTVGPEVLDFTLAARHAFEREEITKMIAKFSHVGTNDLKLPDKRVVHWSLLTDPLSFVLIFSNSIVLAVSTDHHPDWPGWDFIELGFTTFFVCELTLKMCVNGVCDFFLGVDRGWNIADFIFVSFAVIDAMLVSVAQVGDSDFQMFTLMRLVRLCRISRLVRLLRFKIFKELLLMIQGIVAGLRTLFWAIILLISVIFCFGMLMRQTVGRWCENGASELCREEHLAKYGRDLLGTVPRACFTIFRCFTEGCASSDGTPLLVHLYENSWYGAAIVLVYMLIFLAITFGLFNLIMAVFVENTMESAKLDERKRRRMRHKESLILARKLQRIVVQFSQTGIAGSTGDSTLSNTMWWSRASDREEVSGSSAGIKGANRNIQITRDMFRNAVSDPSMEALLEDLEVNVSDPMTLFDTLDADDSGSLDVRELIQGIIKLRGTADKSDVIASLLSIRAMQKSLRKFEHKVVLSQKRLESKLAGLDQQVSCLQAPCSSMANASVSYPPDDEVD